MSEQPFPQSAVDEIAMLRDALDHIAKVAQQTMRPTKRLDWITQRARTALAGKPWSRDLRQTPKNRVLQEARRRQREFENVSTAVDYDNDCAPD